MKNKNKPRLDTYETHYDVDLVVANKYVKLEELQKLYKYVNENELDENVIDGAATTNICRRKSDNKLTMLVYLADNQSYKPSDSDKFIYDINTAAHEAAHVCFDIYDYCGVLVEPQNQEHTAYFIGYLTECIMKTMLNK